MNHYVFVTSIILLFQTSFVHAGASKEFLKNNQDISKETEYAK